MSEAPRVSVVVPTYDQAWALPYALTSIAQQVYRDFEIIVVDDGSTDETSTALAAWARALPAGAPEVRTIRQPNAGTAAAINAGVAAARGTLLTWASSDNVMHAEWLLRLERAIHAGAGAAYAAFVYAPVADRAEALARLRSPTPGAGGQVLYRPYDPRWQIAHEDCAFGPALLMRADVWAAAGPHRGRIAHDLDHWLRVEEACAARGLPIASVDYPLCVYLAHPERATVVRRAEYDAPAWLAAASARRAGAPR